MFNNRRIERLESEVRTLKGQIMGLRLAHLTVNGDYRFEVGEEVQILRGWFNIQNRGYSDRSYNKVTYVGLSGCQVVLKENLVPVYCLVGLDNEGVIYLEEKELIKELADFKSINERINKD